MKQSNDRAIREVPPTSSSKPVLYCQAIVIGLFFSVNTVPPLFDLLPAKAIALNLDALMLLALVNGALAPAACWAIGSLAYRHWTSSATVGHRDYSLRAVTALAVLILFLALYINIGLPFNRLFLTHTHENGAVREFLLLVGGFESEFLQFLE